MSPKVRFFSHCPKFWKFFSLKDPKSAGIWEKTYPNAPIFMAFVTERPPLFCLACTCMKGMLLPQTWSEARKSCILETESCNLVNTFRCIKGIKTKFQFYRLNRPNCALWLNFIGGQGWYTGHHPPPGHLPGQTRKASIYDTAHLGSLNKCQVYLRLCEGSHFKCKVHAGPAKGPGKILKYRSNLRLYPLNFSNKLCIIIFITLSSWSNFFDPLHYGKLFGPPFRQLKTFWPLHFAQRPPHQGIYEHSLRNQKSALL